MAAGWALNRTAAAGGATSSGDETKYDGRHLRERLFTLPRLVAAALVLGLLVWLVEGGGRDAVARVSSRLKPRTAPLAPPPPPPSKSTVAAAAGSATPPTDDGGGGEAAAPPQPQALSGDLVAQSWGGSGQHQPAEQAPPGDDWLPRPSGGQKRRPGGGQRAVPALGDGDIGAAAAMPRERFWRLLPETSTCDGYFGNGFTALHAIQPAKLTPGTVAADGTAAQLWCRSHPATRAVYCVAHNLQVEPSLVTMSRGGEDLKAVMGRQEHDEVPRFTEGAFKLLDGQMRLADEPSGASGGPKPGDGVPLGLAAMLAPSGLAAATERNDNYKRDMVRSTQLVDASSHPCTAIVSDPVIMLTRMEYANLFHTTTGE